MQASDRPPTILAAVDATKHFRVRAGSRLRKSTLVAVDQVSLSIDVGTTLGLVGESGSGKSTLARLVTGLASLTSGSITVAGVDVAGAERAERVSLRRSVQMVFQDPHSSFDPTSSIGKSVMEPLRSQAGLERHESGAAGRELLKSVSLSEELFDRRPSELSGGQLQRAAIARALSVEAPLIVLDEPVSSLDVSTQAQIINLLAELQDARKTAYLFVAHDLALVRHLSHDVAVMYLGRVVEVGPARSVLREPRHPYTAALLAAVPVADPRRRGSGSIRLAGEIPSPIDPPTGCRFHTRCPWAMPLCAAEDPAPTTFGGGHVASCHLHHTGPTLAGETVLTLNKAPSR